MSISHDQFYSTYILSSNANSRPSINDLYKISKQISQLIAKSWLDGGENIRETFLSGDSTDIKRMLEEHDIDINILGDETLIEMDWESFFGALIDSTNPSSSEVFKLKIGYPPKPSEFNLKDSDLREWIEDDKDDNRYPKHPYIPVTW